MKSKNTIPTLLGVIILILGSIAGVYLSNSTQVFRIGADVSTAVKDIRVANISDNSITISWTTDKPTVGYIVWGTSPNQVNKVENDSAGNEQNHNHSVNLTGLAAETKYYYKINSDAVTYDNSGIPWQVSTGPALAPSNNSVLISGNVINASGTPEKNALVYADIGGYLLSTQTSESGNYVFQIGSARTPDLQNIVSIDNAETLVLLSVRAAQNGVASAQIFPASGNPAPTIVIGQTYDFRNEPINNQGQNPDANLNLPEDNNKQSKFNVSVPDETPKPTSVILESLNEGEIITSTQPEFFGKGPGGTELTITVHSEESIEDSVQIPNNGSWSYEVPSDLSPGNHTITISWVDLSGITRFLTRNFVVKAGEAPAFTASESGTTVTPTTTPTLKPSSTPAATVKPSPSLSPTPVATASNVPLPETGNLTPSLLLFMMGLAVLAFSLFVWKVSEN